MCDSVNHTRFPKDDHLPDWARWDNKVTKGDRVECICMYICVYIYIYICIYKTKLRGFSPRANHTDRAAAAGRRS